MTLKFRAFLGLVGHYHCLIKGFLKIIWLLYAYLEGDGATKKKEACSLSLKAKEVFSVTQIGIDEGTCTSIC